MAYNKTKKNSPFLDYETDDDDDVKVTSNPLRKLKKKIRRIEERLKKNPSPELENELSELKEKVLIYEKKEKSSKPKKKKFKKKKIDKAKNAKEKKWAREKRFEEMKERKRQERKKWNKDRERQKRNEQEEKKRKTVDIRIKNEKAKKILSKYSTINNIPMDIITWINNTTKKGYHNLVKKYHPDKNKNYNIDYIKIINEWWHEV